LPVAFVLMKQNRMSVIADRRDHLDLQVNLLTERKATQIIQMLDRLSLHVGVDQHSDPDSRELGRHVAVEHLVDALERRLPDAPRGDRSSSAIPRRRLGLRIWVVKGPSRERLATAK
jgi:uncharacterized membrane protein